ncbi:Aldehyde dehydrogenase domain [Arabidopsis thaliana x Arabidopsis arenosa]|uniref:Aldehyde dehydrogenase domain n=1 Tax=Arabidopsis thaliana x Arabidopsis arenosa TaxID=1240361 RepID=A0A8T1XF11_9BRAS|nr:Aldehyde dehydrogenase domain [Arabidopsis thaliana x Arabidopsis arenosa]
MNSWSCHCLPYGDVGRKIVQAAATSNLKKVSLELGGKSPLLIFNDADVDKAADLALLGCFYNKGDICVASSRVFVQEGIYDKVVEKLVEKAKDPLPKGCLDKLEQICSAFLWTGAPNSSRGAKVSWDSLIWLLSAGGGSLWVSWIHKVIIRGSVLGDGFSTVWFLDLEEASKAAYSSSTIHFLSSSVSQVIANGSWLLPRGRHPVILLLRACLPATPPTLSPLDSDFYLWRNSLSDAPGNFSSSKTWASLHPHSSEQVSWFKSVWFSQRIPKHAFILWVTLRDRLTTRDRLRSWGLSVPVFLLHLSLMILCDGSSHLLPTPELNIICKLIFQAVVYIIWKERNSRVHSNIAKSSALLVKEIQVTIRAKLAGLDRSNALLRSNVATTSRQPQDTYLSTWLIKDNLRKILSLSYIEHGKNEGATLLTGGKAIGGRDKGYFSLNQLYIFADVTEDMKIYKDEIFGPVMSLMKFKTVEEGIKCANNTKYGLAAGIVSQDIDLINTVSRSIKAGIIWVNCYFGFDLDCPYGGYKMGGNCRESGMDALDLYLETNSVVMPLHNSPWIYQYHHHPQNGDDDRIVDFQIKVENKTEAAGFLEKFNLNTTFSTKNMYLFDKKNVLKKYSTPEKILQEFFDLRLEFYKKRKNLELELVKLDNKVNIMRTVLSGESVVSKMKKADFVQELRQEEVRPFPKMAKPVEAAVAGATDGAEESEESSVAPAPSSPFIPNSDYEVLWDIRSLTIEKEKFKDLNAQRDQKMKAFEELGKTTPESLWLKDLEAFETELEKLDPQPEEERQAPKKPAPKKASETRYDTVQEVRAQRDQMMDAVEDLKNATPESLWLKELEELDKQDAQPDEERQAPKKPAPKKASESVTKEASNSAMDTETTETAKEISLDDDDDDVVVSPEKKVRKLRSSPFNKKSSSVMSRLANKEEESSENAAGNSSSEKSGDVFANRGYVWWSDSESESGNESEFDIEDDEDDE